MNNSNTAIATDLANNIVASMRQAWEAAKVVTNKNMGWVCDPEAVCELAYSHHQANHTPATFWDMGGSPALYAATRRELAAQDNYCNAVERRRLRDQGRRIEREAAAAGQTAMAF